AVLQRHSNDKATRGLSIEQRIVAGDVRLTRHGAQVEVHAKATGKSHLSGGHAKTAVGAVVAGTDETALHGLGERFVQGAGACGIDLRYAVANEAVQSVVLGAAEFSVGFAEDEDEIAWPFHVHGYGTTHIGHTGQHREEQR